MLVKVDEPDKCVICQDHSWQLRIWYKKIGCNHEFHERCIRGLFTSGGIGYNKCPLCRATFTLDDQELTAIPPQLEAARAEAAREA